LIFKAKNAFCVGNKKGKLVLAASLGTALSTFNCIAKHEGHQGVVNTQCGRFRGQTKSLKQSPSQELESLFTT